VDVDGVSGRIGSHLRNRLSTERIWSGAYPSRVTTSGFQGWREVRKVAETASTNADLVVAADAGDAEGLVLVAERQTAGRGRLDRSWDAPPGSGLTFSVLLRPSVPATRWGWLPLLTGLAVTEALAEVTGISTRLKWPNDVLVWERKLAGVLAEVRPAVDGMGSAAVIGVGLNVELAETDLPVPTATSLSIEGARTTDRDEVLDAILTVLGARYRSWLAADGDAEACGLRAAYTVRCATVGSRVRVQLPDRVLEGEAVGVEADGRLRVHDLEAGTSEALAAGDVIHVRQPLA